MEADLQREFRDLAAGVRTVVGVVALIFCYFNLRLLGSIDSFTRIYRDMLNGKPLPLMTQWVIQFRWPLLIVGWIIPVGIIAVLWKWKGHRSAFHIVAWGIALALLEGHAVYTALLAPLVSVVSSLGTTN